MFLLRNIGRIDFLMTIHCRPYNLVIAILYKLLNPKGRYYIKMDFGPNNTGYADQGKSRFQRIWDLLRYWPIQLVDIISCESKEVFSNIIMHGFFGRPMAHKLTLLYNGADQHEIDAIMPGKIRLFQAKENLFITVGRIGSPEKNHELILSALEQVELKDWKFHFIGPFFPVFRDKMTSLFNKRPDLEGRIVLSGPCHSRADLYDYYNRAKVFILTSDYEGFPLVFPEAFYFSNYIITTAVGGAKEITNDGLTGKLLLTRQPSELAEEMQSIINHSHKIEETFPLLLSRRLSISWPELICNNSSLSNFFRNAI